MAETLRIVEDSARYLTDEAHRRFVHPLLTSREARGNREIAHQRFVNLAKQVQSHRRLVWAIHKLLAYQDPILETKIAGISVPNPLGISAGLDKNVQFPDVLGEGLGFGLVTVGSITKIAYDGNKQPRIFDLPLSDGLINRMGFPGSGVEKVRRRLARLGKPRKYGLVINFAASNPSFAARTHLDDYISVYQALYPYGDIDEGNVSSPNTLGVRGMQVPEVFRDLMSGLYAVRYRDYTERPLKPLFIKFSPDLSQDQRERDIDIAIDRKVDGVTFSNTTTDPKIIARLLNDPHRQEIGGVSGKPLKAKALKTAHDVYMYCGEALTIKFAGGIATAEDAWNALTYGGATTIDVYSAFVRPNTSTPHFAYRLLRDLAAAMRRAGMSGMEDFQDLRGKRVKYPGGK